MEEENTIDIYDLGSGAISILAARIAELEEESKRATAWEKQVTQLKGNVWALEQENARLRTALEHFDDITHAVTWADVAIAHAALE